MAGLLFYFDACHRELAADLVRGEPDAVALLDLVEHRRILDAEHHGHGGHVEIFYLAMLERDLALLAVDFAYFAVGHQGIGGGLGCAVAGMPFVIT